MSKAIVRAGIALAAILLLVWLFRSSNPKVDTPKLQREFRAAIEISRKGDAHKGREIALQSVRGSGADGEVWLWAAQTAMSEGLPDLALALLDDAPDRPRGTRASALFSAGLIHRQAKRLRQARQAFDKSADQLENPLPALTEAAPLYWLTMDREETRRTLLQIGQLREWTVDELTMYLLAGRVGDPVAEHKETLRRAMTADPEDGDAAAAWARYLLHAESPDEALASLLKVADHFANSVRFRAAYVEAFLANGNKAQAEKFSSGFDKGPAETQLALAGLAIANEQWAQAFRRLVHAFEGNPDDPETNYRLANVLRRLDATELAELFARRAVGLRDLSIDLPDFQKAAQTGENLQGATTALIERLWQLHNLDEADRVTAWYARTRQDRFGPLSLDRSDSRTGVDNLADRLRSQLEQLQEPTPDVRNEVSGADRDVAAFKFVDVAEQAGLDFRYFNGESEEKYIVGTLGGGVAAFDYDNDGIPDLYFSQGQRFPPQSPDPEMSNRLFVNREGKRFNDVTQFAGLEQTEYSVGCAAADFDNDGFQDLFVVNVGSHDLYRNNGDGTFRRVTQAAGIAAEGIGSSAVFSDLDGDGDLDLYILHYVADMPVCRNADGEPVVCHPRDLDAAEGALFENLGDGTFRDVTQSACVRVPNGKSLGVVACDLDRDGRPELYVSNDTTPNFLFRNKSEGAGRIQFEEVGLVSGTALDRNGLPQAGMGIAVGDFDRNGLEDLYVTNFYADVNTLYRNDGDLVFLDQTIAAGLAEPTRPLLGFGTQAIDADLDGWPDLFVLNGHIADNRKHGEPWTMRSQFFANRAGKFLERRGDPEDFLEQPCLGRCLTAVDFDRDGVPDLAATFLDRNVAVLRNETKPLGNRAIFEFTGRIANRDAANVRVVVKAGGKSFTAQMFTGGYLGSDEKHIILGLGAAESIDELTIHWPGGNVDRFERLGVNIRAHFLEGGEPTVQPLQPPRPLPQDPTSR